MTGKVLSVDSFKSRLEEDVREICRERGWSYDREQQRGIAFQIWFGRLLAQHEGVEWNGEDGVFSTNDLKIDVAIEDVDQKALYLIQSKFVSLRQNPPLNEAEVNDFFQRHNLLREHKWVHDHGSEELLDYVGDYSERLGEGWSVHFYFVSTGKASDRQRELVSELEAAVIREDPGLSFQLIDFPALKEYFVEAQTLEQQIPDLVEIDLPRDGFIFYEKPRPTIVAVVKANALVGLYRKERERLFAYNIRSFLGRKGINKDIYSTAANHPDEFFYFNNGVSAICTEINLEEKTGKFSGRNFQIINGAQTIGSLKAVRGLSGNVEVLLRITEGESVKTERGFNADVIRFNNTQNIIKSSDFRSNDPIQLFIEKKFSDLRPTGAVERRIAYIRKRSYKRPHGSDVLRFEDLAKVRYAWLYEPTITIADPKALWAFEQDGGVYEKAFGIDGKLEDYWPDEYFREAVLAVISHFKIESQITEIIKRDRLRYIFLRRLRFFALSLFASYLRSKNYTTSEMLASRAKFDSTFDTFWKDALRELIAAHIDAVQRDKITVFALARSESRWGEIKETFQQFVMAI